jgi:hypothetical protein
MANRLMVFVRGAVTLTTYIYRCQTQIDGGGTGIASIIG